MGSTLEEHRSLHAALERLRLALVSRPPWQPAVFWAPIASQLADLLRRLEAHFVAEEEGGLFEQIRQTAPDSSGACARLLAEHGALLHRLERLRAEAEAGPADAAALAAWREGLFALLADLNGHEERENELLLYSLDGVVGAPD